MTVKQLKVALSKLDDNLLVVLSRDEEGNGFQELAEVQGDIIFSSGEVYPKGFLEEDAPDDGVESVVLWP